ncbi:MAG: hypothetical protein B7X93_11205 [Hydrogenophilales bacterium 17-61-9]|nr:MAG: hypothetical protein B7X93_11205 [Hydrogenophilales bacterium 17-61-9]
MHDGAMTMAIEACSILSGDVVTLAAGAAGVWEIASPAAAPEPGQEDASHLRLISNRGGAFHRETIESIDTRAIRGNQADWLNGIKVWSSINVWRL